jgi:hypothetical protein
MSKTSPKSTEIRTLKMLMVQRGLSVSGLAASCEVKPQTLSNQLINGFRSRHLRIVIENVLGQALWSTPGEVEERRQLIARCGRDPYRMTAAQLYHFLGTLEIRGRSKSGRQRKELIALLQSTFKPKTTNPQ